MRVLSRRDFAMVLAQREGTLVDEPERLEGSRFLDEVCDSMQRYLATRSR